MSKKRSRRSISLLGSEFGSIVVLLAGMLYFFPNLFERLLGFTVLLLIITAVGFGIWAFFKYRHRTNPTELQRRFDNVREMSGQEFETFTADLFTALGYRARIVGGSGDQGVDVIAIMDGRKVAIQCKNYKKAVGNKPVQEVYAGAVHHGCTESAVLAPGGFTKGAFDLAKSVNVRLIDARAIQKHIDKARKFQKEVESKRSEVAPPATASTAKLEPTWSQWTRKN